MSKPFNLDKWPNFVKNTLDKCQIALYNGGVGQIRIFKQRNGQII
nr:MAG TPA: hypothetical protein [Bacteriophage sp.]